MRRLIFIAALILLGIGVASLFVEKEELTEKSFLGVIEKIENDPKEVIEEPTDSLEQPSMDIQRILPHHTDLAAEFTKAVFKTNKGDITVAFFADESPVTVNNFLNLAQEGFFNGTKFHRIIAEFMIQGGDPLTKDEAMKPRWGTGGPEYRFGDEFNNKPLVRGSLAMANAGPNTNGSQFFIVTAQATPWLDGKHTNFGEVIDGMDVVAAIEAAPTGERDVPAEDIVIESIELLK